MDELGREKKGYKVIGGRSLKASGRFKLAAPAVKHVERVKMEKQDEF